MYVCMYDPNHFHHSEAPHVCMMYDVRGRGRGGEGRGGRGGEGRGGGDQKHPVYIVIFLFILYNALIHTLRNSADCKNRYILYTLY